MAYSSVIYQFDLHRQLGHPVSEYAPRLSSQFWKKTDVGEIISGSIVGVIFLAALVALLIIRRRRSHTPAPIMEEASICAVCIVNQRSSKRGLGFIGACPLTIYLSRCIGSPKVETVEPAIRTAQSRICATSQTSKLHGNY